MNRIEREKKTVSLMIRLYCRLNHHTKNELCRECGYLADYADKKLSKCPFGSDKPACNECKVHCYQKDEREKVKSIMRFSGPKMLFRHPYLAVMHLIDTKRKPSKTDK